MTILTIAVMISVMAHAVTPALLPHSPTIAQPGPIGTASQVYSNSGSFGGYDYPTPRPTQNTYPTPGYEFSRIKAYSTIPQVVTTPNNNYLPPQISIRTVPPQVQYYTSTPHTPFIQNVATPKPPQIQNVYIPPVVSTPPSFRIVTTPKPPQVRNFYVPPAVSYQHPTPYTSFRSVTAPSIPKETNFNVGPYQYPTPRTPFQPATTPKVNVPHLTPRPPSRSLNTYLPPVQATSRTTIHTSPLPSQPHQVPSYNPQPTSYTPQVSLQPPQLSRGVQAPEGHYHEHGTPYQFRYLVQDDNEGVDFNEDKVSDGETIRGEYRVLLPDGRRQIVRYVADSINGYNAVVEYEGTAVYPDQVARAPYDK